MNVQTCEIPGVLVFEPRVFADPRGCFLEVFQRDRYRAAGLAAEFVQDNLSRSVRGALRGVHYQLPHPQGKLIYAVRGEIRDVVVDLRRPSPTFGKWWQVVLSAENHRQLWVPPGLAHGFCVLSEAADVVYKATDFWHPEDERTIVWNDPQLAIAWGIDRPLVSPKDQAGLPFAAAPYYETWP